MDNAVLHGDWFAVLPTLPHSAFNLIFIDPPYNIGVDYGAGKRADKLTPVAYLDSMEQLIGLCVPLLSPTGSLWFLIPERWADDIGLRLSQQLPRRNRIIWRETFGQYRESHFPSGHRHLFWHAKKDAPFYTDEIRVASQRMQANDKRAAGPRVPDDVWEFPRLVGNAKERRCDHPCQLPEALLERIIRCSSKPSDVILDPMAGSGTTLRVTQRLGRGYVGIEEQAAFVELINQRLAVPTQRRFF